MTHEELIAKATEHARAFGSDGVLPVKFEEFSKVTLKHAAVVCFGSDTRSDFGAKHLKKLGRLDELSSDTVALKLVGDKAIAFHGLLLLTVGYALLPFVNTESISLQAREVALNKYSKKAERSLTHPLLLNRLHRILQSEGSVISVPPPPIL